ncbi:MAG: CxxH/CxxC protein [Dethiobacter sp.]|jgi:CxxH/CxxC protein (TIGR04129 family)|nr:CxxH/CxxC protein [Dethiobacter sp.]MBS3901881.1 CxxH/CxxC protein [Dethiobacter sp.]MBS3988940.1 CxxH/CxxC protein [Dethiobacter sp.]MBS3989806.1 CxxH/CxxC protein [Dethiobacter sp.]
MSIYLACAEHIEQLIDEFVDQYETSPDLSRVEGEVAEAGFAVNCRLCAAPALYRLSQSGSVCR